MMLSVRISYIKYDLSSITGTVTSAKVMLVPTSEGMAGITNQANLVSDNTWGGTTLTWNNQPAAGTLLTTWTAPAVGTSVQIDVTSQVQAALTGDKKLSIRISSPANQGSTGDVSYASKENGTASYRPVIVIN
ncbi:DNRLRE domain-containing protein [Paenibacillus filicis]|uniref:DNRLRE domain-containing protein n=1 Tax=Paenibacillus gyeongsangnamensis TaxID=3388067 RepID=A0ABT4Q209_9BACL|nr:DNRLRE domain-containing protein [Paenibacillus filicis]MCZ8510915.1 DNRLRE domain-containing protein [Paenibacillus filicis]